MFSAKTAGGRMPLTPSPRTRTTSLATSTSNHSSPFTPPRHTADTTRVATQSTYGNLSTYFAKSTSRTTYHDSPKSNIAKAKQSPRHLELGVSDWTLAGTGTTVGQTPSKSCSRKKGPLRTRSGKTVWRVDAGDRFIANRTASEGLIIAGSAKPDTDNVRPKTSNGEGSTVLASAASAFDLGGHSSEDDAVAALQGLSLNDSDETASYVKPAPDAIAYESSLASACGVSLNTRILAFKPAPPESSKPIDLRSQYNRPLKPANSGAQFRRRVLTAPERVLDAPGLMDDYYLNLLDWSSGNQVGKYMFSNCLPLVKLTSYNWSHKMFWLQRNETCFDAFLKIMLIPIILAIGLERNVYVWSAEAGTVNCLLETSPDTYVSSVKWSGDGAYVAVGLGSGESQIWDVEEGTKLRSMYGHDTRVGVMGWNKHILSTGARSGLVYNHDVRSAYLQALSSL